MVGTALGAGLVVGAELILGTSEGTLLGEELGCVLMEGTLLGATEVVGAALMVGASLGSLETVGRGVVEPYADPLMPLYVGSWEGWLLVVGGATDGDSEGNRVVVG